MDREWHWSYCIQIRHKSSGLINRIVVIPTPKTVIDRVNEMGVSEKQPEGVQFTDRDGMTSINNLDLNLNLDNDDNSNASDESFDHDTEYQEKFDMLASTTPSTPEFYLIISSSS